MVGYYALFNQAVPLLVAFQADLWRDVKDEQAAQVTRPGRQFAQLATGGGIECCAIRYCKAPQEKALLDDGGEAVECIAVHLLVVFVIADHYAAGLGRDDVRCNAALTGAGPFTAAARTPPDTHVTPRNL